MTARKQGHTIGGGALIALLLLGGLCALASCGSKSTPRTEAPPPERAARPDGGDQRTESAGETVKGAVSDPGDSSTLAKKGGGTDAGSKEPGGLIAPAPPPPGPEQEKEGGYVYVPPSPAR